MSTVTGFRHIEDEDLALYALHFLPQAEVDAVEEHVDHCAACLSELAQVQGDLSIYAATVELHAVPAQARERLLKQIAREKKVISIAGPAAAASAASVQAPALAEFGRTASILPLADAGKTGRSATVSILSWSGWAVAAGVAVAALTLMHDRDSLREALSVQTGQIAQLASDSASGHRIVDVLTDPTAVRVTLTKPKSAPAPVGRATYNPSKGALIFLASELDPLQMYKVYELWLIPADGRDPIPAGTFRPDERGNASVIMPALPKGIPAKAFGVTVEDDGGSRTPTQPLIIAGS